MIIITSLTILKQTWHLAQELDSKKVGPSPQNGQRTITNTRLSGKAGRKGRRRPLGVVLFGKQGIAFLFPGGQNNFADPFLLERIGSVVLSFRHPVL
jgi:hypothetical protein